MIIRVFRAVINDGMQEEFKKFFLSVAKPHVEKQPGLISLVIGLPLSADSTEFLMVMHWKDIDAVKKFAGDNWDQAVILDEERHLLKEVFLQHYEMAE